MRELARMAGGMMLLYLYLLLWDWAINFYYSFDSQSSLQLQLLNSVAPYSWSFWVGQVLFGALIPGAALLSFRKGGNLRLRLLAAVFAVVSVVIMRWNYNFAGSMAYIHYAPFSDTVKLAAYTPTWQEYAVAIGVVSYWLLGFSLAARYLPFKSPEH
jgi:Ni/Fe-hydrogenase subunit HybB-like protein